MTTDPRCKGRNMVLARMGTQTLQARSIPGIVVFCHLKIVMQNKQQLETF